jgi:hypothetical protein
LEEASIEAFQLVTQWPYRQTINSVFTTDEIDYLSTLPINTILPNTAQQKIVAKQTHLIEAYEIGDYIQLPRLQNLMLDELEGLRVRWRTIHGQVDPFMDKDEFRRRFHVPEE